MADVLGIYKKLHAIMTDVGYIQKDKENKNRGYWYASEAAIKRHIHESLVKHGVIFNASTANQQVVEIEKTKAGATQYRTTLTLAYRFIDIDDGSTVEGTMEGAGIDDQDKGTYKAITGALKYCLTSQFVIPTGDDPEDEKVEKAIKDNSEPVRKVFGKPQESVAAAKTLVKPLVKPVQSAVAVEDIPITKDQALDIHLSFKAALPGDAKDKADKLLKEWLIKAGFVDADGKASTLRIPKDLFGEIKREIEDYARQF